jgi:hypothetical protein
VDKIGFEKSIYDTTKRVKKTVTNLANALHVDTRERTIREHLFFKKNQPLNPYKLADNERFLRDKDFILDARIVVVPIDGTDSVDLMVITRDVFSIGATVGGTIPGAPEIGIYDANIGGRGQLLYLNTVYDSERDPQFGYSLIYRKSSLLGSLTNVELGYTQMNTGRSIGKEEEYAAYVRLSRPLVSPYTRIAGGMEISRNKSANVNQKPDSLFLAYNYSVFDAWIGYNIGINRAVKNRNRQMLAFRYFNGYYFDQPEQEEYTEKVKYNSGYGYLSEFTFYRQDFYKTRYVFGFGRTEDVPYGISLAFSGGYIKQITHERPYAGIKFNYSEASKKGNFHKIMVESGGYWGKDSLSNKGQFEDITLQVGGAYFTRLMHIKRYKVRSYVTGTYTQIFNRQIIDLLDISNKMIPGFRADSLDSQKRFTGHIESILYTPWSLLGFRFAPFVAADAVTVDCVPCQKTRAFWGYSVGFRTRNENLIFGTMEVKLTYIPEVEFGGSKMAFSFKQNLRVKNTGTFVRPPTLVKYN